MHPEKVYPRDTFILRSGNFPQNKIMFDFVFRWVLWLIAAVSLALWVRYFLHGWKAFENQFIATILEYTVTYPSADSCAALKDGKPMKIVELKARPEDSSVDKDLFEPIKSDPNLFVAGFTSNIVHALRGICAAKQTFFVDSMDVIVMTSHKTDVLAVKLPAAGYNRCIHLDITAFKRWYWIADAILTAVLFLMALFVVGKESILGTIHGALKIIVKL